MPSNTERFTTETVFRPLVSGWLSKIELAYKHRRPWRDVADECMSFFCASTGFMWDAKYKNKFWDGKASPRFRITIAKAFEFVALYGPVLYWRNPQRVVKPTKPIPLDISYFGDPNDPNVQMMFQQIMMQEQQAQSIKTVRSELEQRWLNYTPGEMPAGGLMEHSRLAIVDALIKGRGCLWVRPYSHTGSNRMLTGCFYDQPENLLIDPDCISPTLDDALWIVQRCTHPTWQVEREYKLPEGALKGRGSYESAWSKGESEPDMFKNQQGREAESYDLLTYYKIWSKGGAGSRLSGVDTDISNTIEQTIGDYAYLVVAPGVDYPLNAPPGFMEQATEADVKQAFSWPIPFYKDDRWPVSLLDFYKKPGSCWPIAPMAPGLGELKFINTMISHLCNRIWQSSRDFWAVAKSSMNDLEGILKEGKDQCIIPITDIQGDINKVVQILQQPQTNLDAWKIVEAVLELFDKRVGLSDLLYGMSSKTQDRSATETATKREYLSVRPDDMASRVEDWQTEAARLEKFTSLLFIEPQDVQPVVGQAGAMLWQQVVMNQEMEDIARETDVTIEAGSAKKPNKERDAANLNQLMPVLLPIYSEYASGTSDFGPINRIIQLYGDAIDQDMTGLEMRPPEPQPNPEEQKLQLEQQQIQMEMQQDQEKAQLETQQSQMDLEGKKTELALKWREGQMKLNQNDKEFQQKTRQRAAEHTQKMKLAQQQAKAAKSNGAAKK